MNQSVIDAVNAVEDALEKRSKVFEAEGYQSRYRSDKDTGAIEWCMVHPDYAKDFDRLSDEEIEELPPFAVVWLES